MKNVIKMTPQIVNALKIEADQKSDLGVNCYNRGMIGDSLPLLLQALAIRKQVLSPDSFDIAMSYGNVGLAYAALGEFNKAHEHFNESLVILERISPNSLHVADCYNRMGMAYNYGMTYNHSGSLDQLDLALKQYEKASVIQKAKGEEGLSGLATTYTNMGTAYKLEGHLDLALEQYEKASLILEEKLPNNSLHLAANYLSMGEIHEIKGNLDKALDLTGKSLVIQKKQAPNSQAVADSRYYLGLIYKSLGEFNDALYQFKKCLDIDEKTEPSGLRVAMTRNQMGKIYQSQGLLDLALENHTKAYNFRKANLIPSHPDLILSTNNVSITALSLNKLELALKYANLAIEKDPKYKYPYNTKGLILQKQGRSEEALACFEQALVIDPSYADATIHKLELLTKLSKKAGSVYDINEISQQITDATSLLKNNFDEEYKVELKTRAKEAKQLSSLDMRIELPKTEYEVGNQKFIDRLEALCVDLNREVGEEKTTEISEQPAPIATQASAQNLAEADKEKCCVIM